MARSASCRALGEQRREGERIFDAHEQLTEAHRNSEHTPADARREPELEDALSRSVHEPAARKTVDSAR